MRPYYLGAKRLIVGPSMVQEFSAGSFETGFVLNKIGITGTLEIVDGPSFGVGTGRPITEYDNVYVGGPAHFYLAANGFTQTASIMKVYTAGASYVVTGETLPPSSGLL